EANLSPHPQQVMGLIKIHVPLSFGISRLSSLWQPFLQQYPHVNLQLTLSEQRFTTLPEEFEVIIQSGKLPDASLACRKLVSGPRLLCASPDYLQQYGKPQQLKALAQHTLIAYSQQMGKVD